jgi:hypothetical protein
MRVRKIPVTKTSRDLIRQMSIDDNLSPPGSL